MYIPPDKVLSPQDSWTLTTVIYDEGEGGIAVAFGKWHGNPVIAMRWNGTNEPHKGIGNPQLSGHPTWFILPHETGIAAVNDILVKQATGNIYIRKQGLTTVLSWIRSCRKVHSFIYEQEDSEFLRSSHSR